MIPKSVPGIAIFNTAIRVKTARCYTRKCTRCLFSELHSAFGFRNCTCRSSPLRRRTRDINHDHDNRNYSRSRQDDGFDVILTGKADASIQNARFCKQNVYSCAYILLKVPRVFFIVSSGDDIFT